MRCTELPRGTGWSGADSESDGATLAQLQLNLEPGFQVLAIRRGGSYVHRPRGQVTLMAGDELCPDADCTPTSVTQIRVTTPSVASNM